MIRFAAPLLLVGVGIALLSGCNQPAETTETVVTEETIQTPTRLVFAFQRQKDPTQLQDDAELVGTLLEEELEMSVDVLVPTSYGATVQALISNRAQVAYLSSLPFLLASREAPVEILLVEERDGKPDYDSVLVVAADSPIQSLEDLRGQRIAFTSPTSASGYVFPFAYFVEQGLIEKGGKPDSFFGQASFAGSYDQALMAVVRGQADVAAVSDYTMEGPGADRYLSPEDRVKLRILARVPNVPTHLIAIRSDLPAELKEQIKRTLLDLSTNEPERLKDVYGAAVLVEPAGDHIAGAKAALERTGLDSSAVVEK
ncbi:MAG: phosphate/phosphite/phosphonate ABC transporter substrate-binding protein [Fimbriimonadaceae bacterium]